MININEVVITLTWLDTRQMPVFPLQLSRQNFPFCVQNVTITWDWIKNGEENVPCDSRPANGMF
jgi:hypothetical protein